MPAAWRWWTVTEPLVVLLTASRTWTDARPIRAELERIRAENPGRVLVLRHGACPKGGDMIGERVARQLGYRIERYPARWLRDCDSGCKPNHRTRDRLDRLTCPAAGPRRNQEMVDTVPQPTECVAFIKNASRGASDCVRRVRRAGIRVRGRGIGAETVPLPLET